MIQWVIWPITFIEFVLSLRYDCETNCYINWLFVVPVAACIYQILGATTHWGPWYANLTSDFPKRKVNDIIT